MHNHHSLRLKTLRLKPESPEPQSLAIQLPCGTTVNMSQLPSSPETTPPNTPSNPIVISDSPTPSPKKNTENHSKTVIDLTILERLAAINQKTAIPKPKQPDVGSSILNFETDMQKWITSLKQANLEVVDPAVSDFLWTQFRRWVCAETFKLQDQSYGRLNRTSAIC